MALPIVTVLFLGIALLVGLGILVLVALPHLRGRGDDEEPTTDRSRRHSSRTGR
ncbi:hypothetical protein [Brachybacterium sp. P6-10-X1]|uniref:hypothetical protein n=1 Tax=Brachybacterium sp. P6-10-X1 TaxID=1903186 RepID=UPI0012FC4D8A|nr:hypothetical protein [Brachybacterium sp. P6-10-X1]